MNRPDNILPYDEIDLKLGIKSSLPKVQSTIALAILLWKCSDNPAELVYSTQNSDGIILVENLKKNIVTYLNDICSEENITNDTLISTINQNQLFKSQMESLIVAFELVWKLAKVSFVNKDKAASSERTGGVRYPKKLIYSVNIDIINSVIISDYTAYIRVLMLWIGCDISIDIEHEKTLTYLLAALSEGALFKMEDDKREVIFNQNSIYKKLIKTGKSLDINGDAEQKGSLRILKSLLSETMNPYLQYSNGSVSMSLDNKQKLGNYQSRVDTLLSLSSTKVVIGIENLNEAEKDRYKLANKKNNSLPLIKQEDNIALPKPFLLLAGISGTGKTRFVREQADQWPETDNYCLVSVRPDWHEPSDLLGYISRINGTRYIATDFLKFMIKAVINAVESVNSNTISWKENSDITPFWLCLDEMNLAPVEQYFADYLSILETRKWEDGNYSSESMLNSSILKQLNSNKTAEKENSLNALWDELFKDIECEIKDDLQAYFLDNGIPLPPNLIVAGTVNMDETTHGFSRKVIDRALTLDFQEFFPNDFSQFFEGQKAPKTLTFPTISNVSETDFSNITYASAKDDTIKFLTSINEILTGTPFQLAYRALNEILLSVVCFNPRDETELQAVWDDFLMQKVLPRIEGDSGKLKHISDTQVTVNVDGNNLGKGSILHALYNELENTQFNSIWKEDKRIDLLQNSNGKPIACRSKKKLEWMMKRLNTNHFTDFWV
jgi:hypothetical protein